MRTIVYLARALPGGAFATLSDAEGGFELRGGGEHPAPREQQIAAAFGARVYVPSYLDPVDAALLDALAPSLKHVASYGVGTDHIDLAACRERGILVTNTPGVLTETTADHAFALLLATARRVAEADRFVRAGRWVEPHPALLLGGDVYGRTLGLVGFGHIGQAVARRAAGFGMPILYTTRHEPVIQPGTPPARRVPLDELLAHADFVTLHCPLTDATRDLMDERRLKRMRHGSILINTSRGGVVDLGALLDALGSGHLRGAGLDVFPDEPYVPEALRERDDVVLTPHIGSGTRETRAAMTRLVVEDIVAVAAGRPPIHPVVLPRW